MPKRRGRGEGSISKRKDGRWEARLSLPAGPDGKRRRRVVYGKTRQEVADKLHELQHARRAGASIAASRLTVDQYLEDWIRDVIAPRVRESTLAEYKRHTDRVADQVRGVPLQHWKASDIRALWAQFEREGLGSRTRRAIHGTIRQALADAVIDGLIITNPTDAVKAPRAEAPERRFLSPEQVRRLLAAADESSTAQGVALITLVASTGMRIGEALALRWEDVDLPGATVAIRRNLAEVEKRFVEQEPKTKAGLRTISLPRRAVDRLRKLRRHRSKSGTLPLATALVFHDSKGGWLRKSNLYQRVLHPLLEDAELPRVGWHALRHAHATALLAAGEPIADVAARLGHSDTSLTLRIYAHALPDRGKAIAARVDDLLG